MNRQKFSIIPALVLLMAQAATLNAATHPVANSAQLSAALSTFASGDVIQLTANITHNTRINISGKIVTINLNGFSLTVDCSDEYGLRVRNKGELRLTGASASAKFNVKGRGGVNAESGGKAAVSNATGTHDNGVNASDAGTEVVVWEKASAEIAGAGVVADFGAAVRVSDAEGHSYGVYANGAGSKVIAGETKSTGDSTHNYGAYGGDGAEVTVYGNATVSNSIGNGRYGVWATGAGTKVTVGGNVTSTGDINSGTADTDGVQAYAGAEVSVAGDVTGSYCGVRAVDAGSKVTVDGSVSGKSGLYAYAGAEVSVTGDVTGGSAGGGYGGYGVEARDANTKVTVDGTVGGTYYITFDSITKTINDHEPTSTKSGYHEYTDGSAKVWVRIVNIPKTVNFTTTTPQTVPQGGAANYYITTSGMVDGNYSSSTQWNSNAAGTTSTSAPAGRVHLAKADFQFKLSLFNLSVIANGDDKNQTAGNDVLSRSSLRGTKQSRKYYNALFITGLLRKLATCLSKINQCVAFGTEAMTEMRDVIARQLVVEAIQSKRCILDCFASSQ